MKFCTDKKCGAQMIKQGNIFVCPCCHRQIEEKRPGIARPVILKNKEAKKLAFR